MVAPETDVSSGSPAGDGGRENPAAAESAVSDFHLVESLDGWTLTINLNVDLLAALAATGGTTAPSATVPFTVHVQPNLLPGKPFLANVVIRRPAEPTD
jgi:hypothetical protein